MLSKVKEKVTDAADTVKDTMKDARNSHGDKVPQPPSTSTGEVSPQPPSQDAVVHGSEDETVRDKKHVFSPPGCLSDMRDHALDAAKGAVEGAKGVVNDCKDRVKDMPDDARAAAQSATAAAKDLAAAGAEYTKQKRLEMKECLAQFIKEKVDKAIEKRLDQVPGLMKSTLADPDMPRCVANAQDRVIDAVWKDAKEEIMWEVTTMLDSTTQENIESKTPDCFRAFWRYHLFPYDRTIWRKLKDPVFVLTKAFTAVPVMGVAPMMFVFIFLIIDKSDEFQLISFILNFKGMQFFTLGLIRALVGYFVYYACTVEKEDDHDCENSGPGAGADFLGSSAGLVICALVCWIAFLLLPCSKEYGRKTVKGNLNTDAEVSKPGGRIRPMLWWDLFAACFCIIGLIIVILAAGQDETWQIRANMYWAQIIYGLLAFPFFLYTMPLLNPLMTHARPTAYDPQGRCVRPKAKPKQKETREADVKDEEMDGLFSTLTKSLKMH